MEGAALSGILATGVTGAGVAVGAIVAGALDRESADVISDLQERFLSAWKRDMESEEPMEPAREL